MQKHLTKKIFTRLFIAMLIAISFFGMNLFSATSQTPTVQDKARDILENVMSVDLSKYTLEIKSNSMDGIPLSNNERKITNLICTLTPLESNDDNNVITVFFMVEKDIVINYFVSTSSPQIITTTQYTNQREAVKSFLEKYQTYTKIDSNNSITTLNDVDLTKNTTITRENTKLVVSANSLLGEQTTLRWTHTINGADYTVLDISVTAEGFVRAVYDSRALYKIGDTTINISKEQAIKIAMENLKFYSYDMPDGSVVRNFKISGDNVVAVLATSPVDYELRPYWDIRMMLDEVYPGNVQGITAFVWANSGEVFSYSNIAWRALNSDNAKPFDPESVAADYVLMVGVATIVVAAVIVATIVGVMVKKRQK
ncbi:MAG: hypothetical protein LBQ98_04675 [Nitrososphaerota archaeon]|jgi:hypothetical protein|nr:hypothetical protein [Nitrososphaerota archaeon]